MGSNQSKNHNIIVFKSAGANNDYIVTLRLDIRTPTTLNRTHDFVIDSRHAKFRCKQAMVLSIKHKKTNESINSVQSAYTSNFVYTVGKKVVERNFDKNILKICTSGIHFFMTEETAFFWEYTDYDGEHKSWHHNGLLATKTTIKNGKKHGEYISWYNNRMWDESIGTKHIHTHYVDGQLHGDYKSWHENGKKLEESHYVYGQLHGVCKTWDVNGNKFKESHYVHGQLHREYNHRMWMVIN